MKAVQEGEKILALFEQFYPSGTLAHTVFIRHGRQVAEKALSVAEVLGDQTLDAGFLNEAALLHDIGAYFTHAPDIGCNGNLPYISHGIKGREVLERSGLPRHALVCERHIGVGLTAADILDQELPLPVRDMVPLSLEEQIIAYADLFFSKSPCAETIGKSAEHIRQKLRRYGENKVAVFDRWHEQFGG